VRVTVTVKPGSKKGPLVVQDSSGTLTVYLLERAVDGAANEGLITLLAKHFEISKSKVQIVSGFTSRIKRVELDL
jgi:uncharacterized protein YggU (UPF0235/DUF167 family)